MILVEHIGENHGLGASMALIGYYYTLGNVQCKALKVPLQNLEKFMVSAFYPDIFFSRFILSPAETNGGKRHGFL